MRDFAVAASVQFVQYLVLTVNYRAVAAGLILPSMATDAVCAGLAYFIIRRVSMATGWHTLAGMVTGGSTAAAVGIWLTRTWIT